MAEVELYPHQWDMINSNERYLYLAGGIGSGKTYLGAHFSLKHVAENPKTIGLIGANSYSQLSKATLPVFFSELHKLKVPYKYVANRGEIKVGNTLIHAVTLSEFDLLRGIEIGWAWIDEGRDTPRGAFEVLQGRLRHQHTDLHQILVTSSTAGFNWCHHYWQGEGKTPQYKMITATSFDNPSLPDGYLDTLKDSYDERFYNQEVMAHTINITQGMIYYSFDRKKNVVDFDEFKKFQRVKDYATIIGMDFNINPMTAVALKITEDSVYVFDEFFIMSSDTEEMGLDVLKKYGRCEIVPDSTGKALKTSARGLSDHTILEKMGHAVVPTVNPHRRDRYAAINSMLGRKKLWVNAKCVRVIKDLEQLSYKEGSSHPDTSDSTMGHIADALGYPVFYYHGIVRNEPSKTIRL